MTSRGLLTNNLVCLIDSFAILTQASLGISSSLSLDGILSNEDKFSSLSIKSLHMILVFVF